MGVKGPAPTPAKMRLLKGSGTGRDVAGRKVRAQPRAVPAIPDRPDWLDPVAGRFWDRVAPELERLGIVGLLDVGALEQACVAYARWRADPKPSHSAELRACLVQCGLTPAARLRMTLPEPAHADDEAAFGLDRKHTTRRMT